MANSIYRPEHHDFYDFSKHFKVYVMRFTDRPEFYIRKNHSKSNQLPVKQ